MRDGEVGWETLLRFLCIFLILILRGGEVGWEWFWGLAVGLLRVSVGRLAVLRVSVGRLRRVPTGAASAVACRAALGKSMLEASSSRRLGSRRFHLPS